MDIKKLISNFNKYGIYSHKSNKLIDLKENLSKDLKKIIKKNNKLKTQIIKSEQQFKSNQLIKKNISDLYEKLFENKKINFALIYKNIKGKYYIKARFTWKRKQREIQIGSINSLMKKMQELNLISKNIAHIYKKDNNWDNIKNDSNLIKDVYIFTHLKISSYMISNTLNRVLSTDKQIKEEDYKLSYNDYDSIKNLTNNKEKFTEKSSINDEWYKAWTTQKD